MMSENLFQPGKLPKGLREADLLDWIEGDLPVSREQAVRELMAQDARLLRLATSMRRDRKAMGSLGQVRAPAGLLEEVERTLERQALLGLSEGEPLLDRPPVSIIRPQRRSIFSIFTQDPLGRRLAMAAGLLLVAGGLGYFGVFIAGRLDRPASEQMAFDLPREDARGPEPMPRADHGDESAPLALADSRERTVPPLDVPDPEPVEAPLTIAEALELAGQGRLLVRVVSADTGRAAERVASLVDRRVGAGGWRVDRRLPERTVASLERATPSLAQPPAVVSWDPTLGPITPIVDLSEFAQRPRPTVYAAETRLDEQALESLVASLSRGAGQHVVLEALDEPVDLGDPMSAESILWWTRPPESWTPWAVVPVVIERGD